MTADHYTDRDHAFTAGPTPAPVYLDTGRPCEGCGESAPTDEEDMCAKCVKARREHDDRA